MIVVEACRKCGGWHPGRDRCPPRKRINTGLTNCRHCGTQHFTGNERFCSQHSACRCATTEGKGKS